MRGSRGRLAVRAIQLSALLVVAWFLYHALAGQVGQLSRADLLRWRPSGPALALSFVLLQIVYLAHALLWRTIVRDLELGDLSFRETIRVYFAAGLGKYVPGKVWALAGMAVLAGRAGLPPVASTAAAVLGQAAFMATGMVFLAVTLPGWQTELGGADGPASAILVIGLMLGGAALWLLAVSPAGHSLRERLATRLGERAGERIRATFRLADRITPRAAAAWALAYAATWVLIAASFVALVVAFVPDASVSVRYLAGTIAASLLVGYLLPLPAGIGSREAIMIVLLQPVVPDAGLAIVITVVARIWFTAAEILPLALLPLLRRTAPKENAFRA
jgi:glycosyltransferase 2 family protein